MTKARATVASLLLVLAGCAVPGLGNSRDPGHGWHQLVLPGTARSLFTLGDRGVLVAGRSGTGGGLLLGLNGHRIGFRFGDEPLPVPPSFVGHDGLAQVAYDGEALLGTSARNARDDAPAPFWASTPTLNDNSNDPPKARDGAAPVWLWPLVDNEEDYRAVGVTHTDDTWRLHAWQRLEDWTELDDASPQLYLAAAPDFERLRAGNTEVATIIAGDVSTSPRGRAVPSAWIVGDAYDPFPWRRLELTPSPDRLTDVSAWEGGFWIAGASGGRPVVYDFDDVRNPGSLEVPSVTLDSARPTVLIAGRPIGTGRLILAVQAAHGPELWVRGKTGWTSIRGPEGRLDAAAVSNGSAYLIVDGKVWWKDLGS